MASSVASSFELLADLQIGSTIRLLMEHRRRAPAGRRRGLGGPRSTRYFPPMSGAVPAGTLPSGWFALSSAEAQGAPVGVSSSTDRSDRSTTARLSVTAGTARRRQH